MKEESDGKGASHEVLKDNTEVILSLQKDLQIAIDANAKWLQRDTKLEAQIEKMKCCKNCKYNDCMHYEVCDNCNNLDKWEMKE